MLTPDGEIFGTSVSTTESAGELLTETTTLDLRIDERDAARMSVQQVSRLIRQNGVPQSAETRIVQNGHETRLSFVRTGPETGELSRWTDAERIHTTELAVPTNMAFNDTGPPFQDWLSGDAPSVEFPYFSLAAGRVVTSRYLRSGETGQDASQKILKLTLENGELRSFSELVYNDAGQFQSQRQPMLGADIMIRPAMPEEATEPTGTLSPIQAGQIKSLYRIGDRSKAGRIRYTFTIPDQLPIQPPGTPEQKVHRNGNTIVIDVCANCNRRTVSDQPNFQDGLSPALWIESDAPEIRRYIKSITERNISDSRKMKLLIEKLRKRLKERDFTGHYSALEAFRNRKGDCMEDALLLAAFGRAAGIPTKVASGLVYSREKYHGRSNIFMPHAWTLAYVDGEWRSFDAALGEFDATHIALTIGDGSQLQLSAGSLIASLMTWETMQNVEKPAD